MKLGHRYALVHSIAYPTLASIHYKHLSQLSLKSSARNSSHRFRKNPFNWNDTMVFMIVASFIMINMCVTSISNIARQQNINDFALNLKKIHCDFQSIKCCKVKIAFYIFPSHKSGKFHPIPGEFHTINLVNFTLITSRKFGFPDLFDALPEKCKEIRQLCCNFLFYLVQFSQFFYAFTWIFKRRIFQIRDGIL